MIECILDLGPPIVIEETPEPIRSVIDGDAMCQDSVEMDMGVDEAGQYDVIGGIDDPSSGKRARRSSFFPRASMAPPATRTPELCCGSAPAEVTSHSASTSVMGSARRRPARG